MQGNDSYTLSGNICQTHLLVGGLQSSSYHPLLILLRTVFQDGLGKGEHPTTWRQVRQLLVRHACLVVLILGISIEIFLQTDQNHPDNLHRRIFKTPYPSVCHVSFLRVMDQNVYFSFEFQEFHECVSDCISVDENSLKEAVKKNWPRKNASAGSCTTRLSRKG